MYKSVFDSSEYNATTPESEYSYILCNICGLGSSIVNCIVVQVLVLEQILLVANAITPLYVTEYSIL